MRIGILTFHQANNYGAVLQCYALQKYISNHGIECKVIDYHCTAIKKMHAPRKLSKHIGVKHNVKNQLWNMVFYPRMRMFDTFRETLPLSAAYSRDNIADANKVFDGFISGSDQVFNLNLTGDDYSYFLDFVEDNKRKISYAASMGDIQENQLYKVKPFLERFDALSIREKSTASKISEHLNIHCDATPDPVFLLPKNEWIDLFSKARVSMKRKYLLIYALYEAPQLYRLANEIAEKMNLETVVISRALRPAGKVDKVLRNVSPVEFGALIQNAEYVVTNSFHGTAFSILMEKQFSVCLPYAATSRIVDLLNTLGLENRIMEDFCETMPIDYSMVRTAVQNLREQGQEFLCSNMSCVSTITEEIV